MCLKIGTKGPSILFFPFRLPGLAIVALSVLAGGSQGDESHFFTERHLCANHSHIIGLYSGRSILVEKDPLSVLLETDSGSVGIGTEPERMYRTECGGALSHKATIATHAFKTKLSDDLHRWSAISVSIWPKKTDVVLVTLADHLITAAVLHFIG